MPARVADNESDAPNRRGWRFYPDAWPCCILLPHKDGRASQLAYDSTIAAMATDEGDCVAPGKVVDYSSFFPWGIYENM